MIKGLNQGGRYIIVSGGQPGSNYINNFSGAQGVGNMRFNTANQNIEIWDGNGWIMMQTGYASVQLNSEAEELLDWAKEKRRQEIEIERLAHNNRAVKIAYNAVKKAEEQLKITTILAKDEEQTTS